MVIVAGLVWAVWVSRRNAVVVRFVARRTCQLRANAWDVKVVGCGDMRPSRYVASLWMWEWGNLSIMCSLVMTLPSVRDELEWANVRIVFRNVWNCLGNRGSRGGERLVGSFGWVREKFFDKMNVVG